MRQSIYEAIVKAAFQDERDLRNLSHGTLIRMSKVMRLTDRGTKKDLIDRILIWLWR